MILALETSTQLGSVAFVEKGQLLWEKSSPRQKSHSETINLFIQEGLQKLGRTLNEISTVAIGQGPGSFTGIRVAGNIGKTLSYSLNIPLICFDSLTLLAAQVQDKSLPVLSIINAYKNMVYYGFYSVKEGQIPQALAGPHAIPVKNIHEILKHGPFYVCGDGFEVYRAYFEKSFLDLARRESSPQDFPLASTLGFLAEKRTATLDWKSYLPLYIRASEAEETAKGIVFTPL